MKKQKVNFIQSMGFKVQSMMGVGVILAVIIMALMTFPNIQTNIQSLTQSYMLDDVSAGGCSSSYAYIVDTTGTMRYHPTESKVGQPVENSVVTGLVADLNAGKTIEPACVEYEYKGVGKYASYYIPASKNFILVITSDESDIFANVRAVFIQMVIAAIVTIIAVVLFGVIASNRMFKPLGVLTGIINKTADLDLTPSAEQEQLNKRKDETGMISRAVSLLRKELVEVIRVLNDQSHELSNANHDFEAKFASMNTLSDAVDDCKAETSVLKDLSKGLNEQVKKFKL